jgi:hypothetical protein
LTVSKAAFKVVEGRFDNFMYDLSKFTIKDKDGVIHSAVYSPNWRDKMSKLKVGYWGRVTLEERGGDGMDIWEMTDYQYIPRPEWAGPKPAYGGAPAGAPAAGGQQTFNRPYTAKAPAPEVIKAMAKKDKLIAIESALKSAVELGIAMKPSGKFEEVFDACVEAAIRAADKMDAAASK